MWLIKQIFSVVLCVICLVSFSESQSCAEFFQYTRANGNVEGFISYFPPKVSEHNLKVTLSIGAQLPSSYVGELILHRDTQSAVDELSAGGPLLYRILFPITHPLPLVTEISYNGNSICSGESVPDYTAYITTINLTHRLTTNIFYNGPNNYYERHTTKVPNRYFNSEPSYYYTQATQRRTTTTSRERTTTTKTTTTTRPLITTPRSQHNFYQNSNKINSNIQCGTRANSENLVATSLLIGGKKAGRRDFPWLVAQYDRTSQFKCGGSLVSSRIVVSAAHCFQEKGAPEMVSAYDTTYYLGKYEINKLTEDGFIISGVERFELHPDWKISDQKYDSDIGIAVLTKTIKYTNTVRPICLWTGTQGYSDIIGKKGLVAGWGINEIGVKSDFPTFLSLPVVSEAECLRSSGDLARKITRTSFCVGDKSGRAPCNGDSGGGFVMRHGSQFYLRGIVSIGLFNEDGECSSTDYVSFTDVSLFTNWIYSYINSYA